MASETLYLRKAASELRWLQTMALFPPPDAAPRYTPVKQRYSNTHVEGYGMRSSCVITSVINAARMIGINAPDVQDALVRNRTIPWANTQTGGIFIEHVAKMEELALILEDHLPGTRISYAGGWSFQRVLESLHGGKAITLTDPSFQHSIALAGLYKSDNPLQHQKYWSWRIDPEDLIEEKLYWLEALQHANGVGIVDRYGVGVLATFQVAAF